MSDPLSGFAAQLRKWFQSPFQIGEMESLGDIEFNRLAGDLFRYQFELNPAYRAWCEARNVTPVQAPGWREIPLVPTAAFKEVELTCLKPAERTRCFHSSGTTGHRPSRHYHHAASLSLYEDSLAAWFVPHLLPDLEELAGNDRLGADLRLAIVSLTPPADDIPQSSLAHMIATAMERFGASDSVCVEQEDRRRRLGAGLRPLVVDLAAVHVRKSSHPSHGHGLQFRPPDRALRGAQFSISVGTRIPLDGDRRV